MSIATTALAILIALTITTLLAPAASAQYTESTLYTFTGGSDGSVPHAGVITDSKGNLYGTTYYGGNTSACKASGYPPGCGVVFELSPTGSGPWTETVLHSFCPAGGTPCADTDGLNPYSSLIFDSKGNLYGTTVSGGVNGFGTVFELSPPSSGGGAWTETVLYSFCSVNIPVACFDGANPYGSLVLDSKGNLYGTTVDGGGPFEDECSNSCGMVFELSPPSSGSGPWTETLLSSFGGIDSGGVPYAGLAFDSKGNLYGTEFYGNGGGDYDDGVVFELSPPGSGSGLWMETVLYSFSGTGGSNPFAGVTFDSKGNLYGTTEGGGAIGGGVVFELSPPTGGSGAWTEALPYSFKGGSDGGSPDSALIVGSQGNLYGTTLSGGSNRYGCSGAGIDGCGVAFELRPPAGGSGSWTQTVLYTFTGESDGALPHAGLMSDSRGNLYGTASAGGATTSANCPGGILVQPGCGVLFELAPNTATAVSSSLNPSMAGVSVTFTASVSGGSSPTGTVNFSSNGAAIGGCTSVTLASGKAQCTTATLSIGSDAIVAGYSGDSNNGASSGTLTQVVNSYPTSAIVASSQNPSYVGESVAFTAAVSGGSSPTGTVGFTSNGATISGCGAITLASGKAECNTAFATKGSYTIVATYSGDSKNAGSSGTLTQVVGGTSTTVASSLNPSTSGQSVTLTATVAPAGPPVPSGTVNFTSLGTAISGCTDVTLSASLTAACTTSTLPVGTNAIVATYSGDTDFSGSTGTFSQLVNPVPTPVQFVPVTPCRIVDTRGPDGYFGGPALAAGKTRNFTLPLGPCAGIPSTAAAYSLNVTVIPPAPLGYLTIWPAGEGQPAVSTLNSLDGRTKANAAIVPAGTIGAVSVYVNNATNLLLDINGYFESSASSSLEFYPVTPCRVADTRKADGPLGGPTLVAAIERDFPILSGTCSIPNTAKAYSLNFTVVPPATGDTLDYLTVWPQGETRPVVSTLNNFTGTIVANAAIVPSGTAGGIAVYPSDATNLLIDVNGYFAAPGTGGYNLYTVTPCRVLDTRKTTGLFSDELTVNVAASTCAPSSTDKAYVFNATVVPSGDLGYLTLWPDGETQPGVSTLNAEDGAITSNLAIVPNSDGKTDAFASGTTQLILDVSAYFAP